MTFTRSFSVVGKMAHIGTGFTNGQIKILAGYIRICAATNPATPDVLIRDAADVDDFAFFQFKLKHPQTLPLGRATATIAR